MKISVIIPTYRRYKLLQNCLKALVNQTFDKTMYEIIVVSDGRDEETISLSASHYNYPSVTFYELPEKKGPAAARNFGWRKAKAELIAFTDDDCIPDPGWLEAAWQSYDHTDEIVYSGIVIVPICDNPTDYQKNIKQLEHAEFVTANCFCTRQALEHTEGFDERFRLAWREDSDLYFNLLIRGIPVLQIEDAIVVHPVREASWGISIQEQKKGKYNALLYKKYPGLYRKKIQSQPQWNYYLMVTLAVALIVGVVVRSPAIQIISGSIWFFLLARFILKRMSGSSRSVKHIMEMVFTSLLIPFLSIYWQIYGAVRYKVWFL